MFGLAKPALPLPRERQYMTVSDRPSTLERPGGISDATKAITARAAVVREPGAPFDVQEIEVLPPRAGEVLVRMRASGVCHSDLHFKNGDIPHPLPVILGHEGAGVVEQVGPSVATVAPGDHVVGLFKAACDRCYYCFRGRPALCDFGATGRLSGHLPDGSSRFRRDGQDIHHFSQLSFFSEYTVVPEQALQKISHDIPFEQAALVGCSVTTGVGAVLFAARVDTGDSVLVIGAGGVGLNAVQGARLAGANPILVADVVPAKLQLARDLGATHTIDAREQDPVQAARDLTDGRGVDYAFEVIGRVETMQQGYDAIRRGGTLVVVGIAPHRTTWPISPLSLVMNEKTVKGTTYGSANLRKDMPMLLDLYAAGRLEIDRLIRRRYRLDEINEAYSALEQGEVARGVIVFE
jgi:S-(hydroxymethyl)glutathione dehydrogenase/alcohol dehydrogenase